ncbi:MAG: hypothetical protein WBM01_24950 [Mycobacterium sp.]|uniref:GIY-YIG nuclease family protein n=1 Tax=Mycobacterium sp. TaxID=1785 RepID=UPI003C747535
MAGTLDRVVTYVATQLMLATACTADEVSENAWLRGAYRVGQGDAMTSGRSVPCRSFTKVHAALVSWIVDDEPWVLEENLIATLDVPLNLQGNSHNLFYPTLKMLRAEAEAVARNLPVI